MWRCARRMIEDGDRLYCRVRQHQVGWLEDEGAKQQERAAEAEYSS
jgi:hypothetical protein